MRFDDECVDCVITSPPYWGLRDYGEKDQWGLEPDFHDYLDKMMLLMEQLKRVLKKTGTCWVNLGDTYAGGRAHSDWSGADDRFKSEAMKKGQFTSIKKNHIEAKSQYGIPQRFYTMCIDNGWIARNWVTWMKDNAMPFSGKDRLKNMTEPVMFFAKDQKYFFDLDPVRKKDHPFFSGAKRKPIDKSGQTGLFEDEPSQTGSEIHEKYEDTPQSNVARLHKDRDGNPNKQDNTIRADGKPDATKVGFNERWKNRKFGSKDGYNNSTNQTMNDRCTGGFDNVTGEYLGNEKGANPGDVLRINTKPTKEAHFATFPVDLPKTILQMACPPDGIVLDPFFGSGTTGIAAEELGLKWVGIELNPEYVKIARKRLEPYMSEKIV